MVFDYSKLKGKIKEVYDTQGEFAAAISVSRTSVSEKLNNKSSWTQTEIKNACKVLSIATPKIPEYFFTLKV